MYGTPVLQPLELPILSNSEMPFRRIFLKDIEYHEAAYVRYDAYNPQTEVYSGFGSTEVESRAMLLIDLLDKKVLTLSDLNLKSLNRI